MNRKQKIMLLKIAAAVLLTVLGYFVKAEQWYIRIIPFMAAYLIVGYDIVVRAAKNILNIKMLDENFLMTVATVGAFCIGEYAEATLVMILNRVGLMFEDYAVNKSRRLISEIADIIPNRANVLRNSRIVSVSPEQINIGEITVVLAGERIPVDGVVVSGASSLDTSAVTGEFLPVDVCDGDEVLSGCINKTGTLHIKATKEFCDSTASRIVELIENAAANKSKSEKFITKFARVYTPIVVVAAAVLAFIVPAFFSYANFTEWLNRALIFLVVSCPCALVISVPLGYFAGIGSASKKGVLIKGSNYLEMLGNVDSVLTDKTGTLTTGEFSVTDVVSYGCTKQQVINTAAMAESFSNHPVAEAIKKAAENVQVNSLADAKEIAGKGIKLTLCDDLILVGTKAFLEENGIRTAAVTSDKTSVYVAKSGLHIGTVLLDDTIRSDAYILSDELKKQKISLLMLTGDNEKKAAAVADKLGITQYYSSLLPEQKVEIASRIKDEKVIAFIGDGINDAPVLTLSDVGIAMGAKGSDIAIEQADVIIMDDKLSSVPLAILIAKKTNAIVRQNIILSLSLKAAVLALSAFGLTGMWSAIFADVGLCVIAVLNSMRILKFK